MSPDLLSGPWWIGLEGWVLQDGDYTDFATGERRQFALELGYARRNRLRPSPLSDQQVRCRYSGHDAIYGVTGRLLRAGTSRWATASSSTSDSAPTPAGWCSTTSSRLWPATG